MKKRLLLWLLIACYLTGFSQKKTGFDPGNFSVNGYLQYMENIWLVPDSKKWETMGSLKNRLDFRWYKGAFSVHVGGRTFLNYGGMVYDFYPYLADNAAKDYGLIDATFKWVSDSSWYLITNIDRANLNFTWKNLEAVAGRQRINWGMNMIWNPNDIFNTFNYFDFDYTERPGCDAIKLQYYTGNTSSLQVAWKTDSDKKPTVAGMYKFNRWKYDIQFLGGYMTNNIVLGGGWSGQIKNAGFTGELTWFHPTGVKSDPGPKSSLVLSTGANYTFTNSLFLHGSLIYNSDGTTGNASWGDALLGGRNISAKSLTPSKMELFGEAAYQITPLIRADLAGIVNPFDGSAFAGPSLDLSLTDNISLFLIGQLFFGKKGTEYGDYGQMLYGRLKWNF